LLFALGLIQMALFYPRMPAMMASHFGSGGRADDWMARPAFFALMAGIHVAVTPLLLAVAWAMKYLPTRFVNLPHKEYWAAPEREDETRDWLYGSMLWFACATLALLNAIEYLTFRANLRSDQSMGGWAWVLVGIYLAWTAGWVVRLIWRFARVPQEDAAGTE